MQTMEPKIIGYKADGAIPKGSAVKIGTDNEHVAKCTAASDKSIGVIQGATSAAEDLCEVAMQGGGAKFLAQGTTVAGDVLCSHTDGSLKVSTTTGDRLVGVALESAVAGDIGSMVVSLGLHY